jgi:hypothetical protein
LAAGGCGGGDEKSDSVSPTQTRQETRTQTRKDFIAAARATCDRFRERANRARNRVEEAQRGNDPVTAASAYREAAKIYRDFANDLAGLHPPPGDTVLEQVAGRFRSTADLLQREADAVEHGDFSAAQILADEISKNAQQVRGLAEGYGIPCLES